VKMSVSIAVVLLLGFLVSCLGRLIRRRTIDNWFGWGIEKSLDPSEAALLLALDAGTILALVWVRLDRKGQVRILDEAPLTLEWIGREPTDRVESAFHAAIDSEGRLLPEKVKELLEVLWGQVNAKMERTSGIRTGNYYRRMSATLSRQMLATGDPEPAAYPWALFQDARGVWDRMGAGKEWAEFKRLFRVKERFRRELLDMKEISETARTADEGFFAYRKDLIDERLRRVENELANRLPSAYR
jgi:hypothetical protein